MLSLLLIWLAVGVGLLWLVARRRGASAGLPLAYYLGLSLIHIPGAMLYLDHENSGLIAAWTRLGFEQTVIGMVAFLGGVMIATMAWPVMKADVSASNSGFTQPKDRALGRLSAIYLAIGAIAYFAVLPLVSNIPSAGAIISAFGSLLIVGICLRLWHANASKSTLRFWLTMALIPALPLATMIQGGFIGFGTYWAIAVVTFMFAQSARKVLYLLAAPVVVFAGISLFVTYMAARTEFRQLVWYEQADFGARVERVADIFRKFEWLDTSNFLHRKAIDDRLNQNFLVGASVERLEAGAAQFALGGTFGSIALVLIPRAIWPDKPQVGGGGTIVQDFTGLQFAEGTSVGAGQVLEFYVNFGVWGVVSGFLFYGWLIGRLDQLSIEYLRMDDQKRFLLWFLTGLTLLQPGGNLLEITVSMVSSVVAAFALGYFLNSHSAVDSIKRSRPVRASN